MKNAPMPDLDVRIEESVRRNVKAPRKRLLKLFPDPRVIHLDTGPGQSVNPEGYKGLKIEKGKDDGDASPQWHNIVRSYDDAKFGPPYP